MSDKIEHCWFHQVKDEYKELFPKYTDKFITQSHATAKRYNKTNHNSLILLLSNENVWSPFFLVILLLRLTTVLIYDIFTVFIIKRFYNLRDNVFNLLCNQTYFNYTGFLFFICRLRLRFHLTHFLLFCFVNLSNDEEYMINIIFKHAWLIKH